MPDPAPEPEPYVEAHLRESLARDPRVGEMGVDVRVHAGTVTLTGALPTPDRREAILEVVRELVPDMRVEDAMTVQPTRESGEPEVVN